MRTPGLFNLCVLLALSLCNESASGGVPLDQLRRFEQANQAFANATTREQYLDVAALYQSILDAGLDSGAVHFNLGNSLAAAGETGRALRSYRQAQRVWPRDPVLDNNLSHVLDRLGAAPPSRDLLDHLLFWQGWLSFREKGLLLALFATLAFLCGVLSLVRTGRWRGAALAALLAALLLGASFGLDLFDRSRGHGVVIDQEVVARMGNSESFQPAINEPLQEGAEFLVRERTGDWVRIEIRNGLEGWIPAGSAAFY